MIDDLRSILESRLLPVFRDRTLEREYRDSLITLRRGLIRTGLILAALLFTLIEPVARYYIPSDIPQIDQAARWIVHVPAVLLSLVVFQVSHNYALVERTLLTCLAAILLSNAVLMWLAEGSDRTFYAVASIQVMLFGFILIGLRFRQAFICILLCFGMTASAGFMADMAMLRGDALTSAYVTPLLVFFGLAFSAYMLDISSRAVFVVNLERNRELAQRLALESERSKWLRVGSEYLNHEIKNALLGVTSSLSLIRRRNTDTDLAGYLDRAENSAQFMKRLLNEVSNSTSLETALEQMHWETVDFTQLLQGKANEFQDIYLDRQFTVSADSPAFISCDVDRILQALDKLLDNAVVHCDGKLPISINLTASGAAAILTIANRGDPLTGDAQEIFEPFVSHKRRVIDTGFGFGLYIVKKIIEAHGGSVSAHPLKNPDGAEFVVTLPILPISSQMTTKQ